MTNSQQVDQKPPDSEELTRFERLARALFGVKREDVPKHEPKKREPKDVSR